MSLILILVGLIVGQVSCQNPILSISNWVTSDRSTVYNGAQTDVTSILANSNNVYIKANGLPKYLTTYGIYTWTANPNKATAQNYVASFPLNPTPNLGPKLGTPMGAIGFWTNGMPIYNAKDGFSYNNLGVWNRDAYLFEGISFDRCGGHPDNRGRYHNHLNPNCLYNAASNVHSPIIGWSFDGYPVYGPFGYSDPLDATSPIKRILPGWKLRSITTRTTLWNGTVLSSANYGPPVDATYYLGYYIEDWGWASTNGDLDQYNGRFCKTPEYPNGIYAYFVPTTINGLPAFPYSLALQYYGNVPSMSTNVVVPPGVITIF